MLVCGMPCLRSYLRGVLHWGGRSIEWTSWRSLLIDMPYCFALQLQCVVQDIGRIQGV